MKRNTGYNGNPLISKADTTHAWTAEMISEYQKCMDDPVYFIKTYAKIISIDDGLIPFDLYDYQEEIVSAYPNNRNMMLNQSRQSGKTAVVVAIILHFIIFNKDKMVAILANKGAQAMEIMSRVQLAYENLPMWVKPGVKEWNKGSFELDNGTKVMAAASSSSAIRGRSVSLLYLDEFAFIPNWDDFAASVLPTISSGKQSRLIASSTPNGLNHFYKYCMDAQEGRNDFWYKEVSWDMVPGRDEHWKAKTLADISGDIEKFNVEYCCEFMGSSGTLIRGAKLKSLVSRTPIQTVMDGKLKQYYEPVDERSYVMVCDVSRGKGLDYSAFSVFDVTEMPYQQVATYRNNLIIPPDYADVIYRVAKIYNEAAILVEINDIGGQVSDILYSDYEYENLLATENGGRAGKRVSTGFGGASKTVDLGIRTSKASKAAGCSMAKILIEGDKLIINDSDTIHELMRFSKKANSYEAEENCHDDLVMGVVLFGWLADQPYFKELTDVNMMEQLRERTQEEVMEDLAPFGFIDDGVDRYEPNEVNLQGEDWF